MGRGLCVHSEIGRLRTVMLHRPGDELLNLSPANLDPLLFDDIPFLQVAQEEHDAFAKVLRDHGVEVLYLDQLVAEALDATPGLRQKFTRRYIYESGVAGVRMKEAIHERLDDIGDTLEFVDKTIAGIRRDEVDLGAHKSLELADLVGTAQSGDSDLVVDPLPNLYFSRDPFVVVGRGVCLNHMYSETRRRETLYGQCVFTYHPKYAGAPLWFDRDGRYHMEGGDILNLNAHTLAVGISQRTQSAAIDELAYNVFWGDRGSEIDTIYALLIPESRAMMHLDTVFTQVDVDKFLIHPGIMGTLRVFRVTRGMHRGEFQIRTSDEPLEDILADALGLDGVQLIRCGGNDPIAGSREQWNDGSNTLALAPGQIVVYQRNSVTNEILYKAGLELFEIPSAELSRGRGGPHCMSMPFYRDEL
ncbi:MAG: arginine deiminase [Coriobacteriales bacterium]|nr:arginine deiminase [Coriobacteriales bacterium]